MSPRGICVIAGIALATMAPAARGADIQPGLWELVLESRAPASPDFFPAPSSMNQCLTAQDAQDPSRVLGGMANPGASGCAYIEKSYAGDTFRFRMQCAGSLGVEARGEIVYTATTMNGSIVSTANAAGQQAELQSRITARRLGDC